MKQWKNQRERIMNLPIDVIHGIQESRGGISWINDNTVNWDMSFLIQQMMLINVPPPSGQTMVTLPNVEHLVTKVSKVRVILKHGLEFFIGLLPKWTPRIVDVIGNMQFLIKVVVGRDIQDSVTVTVSHNKFIF
jgi:hypothetical protein